MAMANCSWAVPINFLESMIVFDLQCEHHHTFEGWFSSSEDFESQQNRGLVECPMCNNKHVVKKLSAPRINLGASAPATIVTDRPHNSLPAQHKPNADQADSIQVQNAGPATLSKEAAQTLEKMQSLWLEMAQHVIANTEDVGTSFAEEARKIHYNEAPERNIRGHASADEAAQLREEGIDVHAFAIPAALKGSLQ
jgi:hypothetical protein